MHTFHPGNAQGNKSQENAEKQTRRQAAELNVKSTTVLKSHPSIMLISVSI